MLKFLATILLFPPSAPPHLSKFISIPLCTVCMPRNQIIALIFRFVYLSIWHHHEDKWQHTNNLTCLKLKFLLPATMPCPKPSFFIFVNNTMTQSVPQAQIWHNLWFSDLLLWISSSVNANDLWTNPLLSINVAITVIKATSFPESKTGRLTGILAFYLFCPHHIFFIQQCQYF